MTFEWDERKNLLNKQKHHISFENAAKVFLDENRVAKYDESHSTIDEERIITIGMADDMLYVVYTERQENIRIISARLADKDECNEYYKENDIGRYKKSSTHD